MAMRLGNKAGIVGSFCEYILSDIQVPSYCLWLLTHPCCAYSMCNTVIMMELILYTGCELCDEGKGTSRDGSLEGQFCRSV